MIAARILRVSSAAASSTSRSFSSLGPVGKPTYTVPPQALKDFRERGYAVLPSFLSEEEILPIERIYNQVLNREIPFPGKDFCDMSQPFSTPFEKWGIVNAMLPRVYHPPLQGNIYELRAAHVAAQLFKGVKMGLDYDQLLNKVRAAGPPLLSRRRGSAVSPTHPLPPPTTLLPEAWQGWRSVCMASGYGVLAACS